jgi:replicative DNA helicase
MLRKRTGSGGRAKRGRAMSDGVPFDLDAERSLLGSMMLNADAFQEAIAIVGFDHESSFHFEPHQHIYHAMLELYMSDMPFDPVMLMRTMESLDTLKKADGISYVVSLTKAVHTSANFREYAKIVVEMRSLRKMWALSAVLKSKTMNKQSIGEILLDVESEIGEIAADYSDGKVFTAEDAAKTLYVDLRDAAEKGVGSQGVATGVKGLDSSIGGLQPSDMAVLAARPSVGKTALSLAIMRHAALELGVPTLMFSLEMSVRQLMMRHAMATDFLNPDRIRHQWQVKAEIAKLERFQQRWQGVPCEIVDQPGLNAIQMRSAAKRFSQKHKGKMGLIIIDYLQLMTGDGKKRREEQISEISRRIKALARELDWPVLALSQLNREGDDGEPKLSQLRESGAIEQDADMVFMMWRPKQEEGERWIKIKVAKNRNGPIGDAMLWFDGNTQTFSTSRNEADQTQERNFQQTKPKTIDNIEVLYEEDQVEF